MSKLGVGVGDEFPAEQIHEIRTDEDGVLHHHHYYRRRRGGFLRVILWIMLISLLFRGLNYMTGPDDWGWRHPYPGWHPYYGFAGIAGGILIVGGALWLLRNLDRGDRR